MNAVTTSPKLHDCRDAFVAVLERLGAEDPKVVAVCNDSVGSSKLGGFKAKWPDRLVNVGDTVAPGQEIARLVGCSREMAGRVLKKLQADGILHARGKTIVLYGTR